MIIILKINEIVEINEKSMLNECLQTNRHKLRNNLPSDGQAGGGQGKNLDTICSNERKRTAE